jgi:plastocyanin
LAELTGTDQRFLAHLFALALAAGSGANLEPAVVTGALEGEVTYEGEAPPPTIVMEGGDTQRVLHVGAGGGLRFAVAFLDGPLEDGAPTLHPATLDQVGFIFRPPVLAVREGQPVRFTNQDGANHTVRSHHGEPANRFNVYTGAGQEGTHRFMATKEAPAVITCDIHPWMIAWIYAFDHRYFAVTDQSGRFRISGIPAGRYQLAVRQPAGSLRRDLPVLVAAGETARVKIRFTAAEVMAPGRPDAAERQR